MHYKKEQFQEYFKNHNSLTLYREDGLEVTYEKGTHVVLFDGTFRWSFYPDEKFIEFFEKKGLSLEPQIEV